MIQALLLLFALGLVVACWTDLTRRIIPNELTLAIALTAPAFWLAQGLAPWPDMAIQLALGAGMFALFAALFAAGLMGGGDVKLIGAITLWLPLADLLPLLTLTALAGGVVTILTIAWHRLRRAAGRPEVPYGVAISAATLACVGQRYLYLFP